MWFIDSLFRSRKGDLCVRLCLSAPNPSLIYHIQAFWCPVRFRLNVLSHRSALWWVEESPVGSRFPQSPAAEGMPRGLGLLIYHRWIHNNHIGALTQITCLHIRGEGWLWLCLTGMLDTHIQRILNCHHVISCICSFFLHYNLSVFFCNYRDSFFMRLLLNSFLLIRFYLRFTSTCLSSIDMVKNEYLDWRVWKYMNLCQVIFHLQREGNGFPVNRTAM